MNREIQIIANGLLAVIVTLLLAACASRPRPMDSSGIFWGTGTFSSNGEHIYFTAPSERVIAIDYKGGPASNGWMMGGGGRLACASCHGPDGSGGIHSIGMIQVMDAKDIRCSVLEGEFDPEKFRLAVVNGKDPVVTQLNTDMTRWDIGNDDLADLFVYIKTLP